MHIHASVRPNGLKRGVTDKKLGELLGFKEAVGLTDVCGMLALSATQPREFFFLKELYEAVTPMASTKTSENIVQINGKETARYSYDADDAVKRQSERGSR